MSRSFRLVLAALLCACSSGNTFNVDGGLDGSGDGPPIFTLRVDPNPDNETVILGVLGGNAVFHALRRDTPSSPEVDVTSSVTWTSDDPSIAASSGGGVFALEGVGGATKVHATLSGVDGNADLVVKATGSAYLGGTDSSAAQKFAAATPDPNAANAPAPEYPLNATVLPGNLPPIEFQWTQAADNNLYRLHLTAPNTLDVYLYTTALQLLADAPTWTAIEATVRDQTTTWTIEATGPTNLLRTSAASTMTVASDTIDNSAIYVWQSSTGTFHVLDMVKGTDVVLPTNAPALQPGQPCSGCHRISRDGKRFAYTYNGGNFQFGALSFDAQAKSFQEVIAPGTYRATYATFNPNESTEVPAMIVTAPDNVPQNTAGTVRLELRDPDNNAVVPSNIAAMIAQLPKPNPGQATSMPDWSPDGSFVVFAAYDSDINYVRLLGDDIVLASIVEAPVSFSGGTFTFGTPKVLVAANSSDNPDTGQNNLLPAISPDGTVVAFTRAAGWWSIKTQTSLLNLSGQIAMVRRSDGQVIELKNGSNGAGTTFSSTWPQWAPTIGKKYAWLAYASERPYGHELTPQNKSCGSLVQGQGSCKQLWVMAIDLGGMQSGTADPSFSPFWIPSQSIHAQYVSPQWTKAVLAPQ